LEDIRIPVGQDPRHTVRVLSCSVSGRQWGVEDRCNIFALSPINHQGCPLGWQFHYPSQEIGRTGPRSRQECHPSVHEVTWAAPTVPAIQGSLFDLEQAETCTRYRHPFMRVTFTLHSFTWMKETPSVPPSLDATDLDASWRLTSRLQINPES
jgi:hypothetical protein